MAHSPRLKKLCHVGQFKKIPFFVSDYLKRCMTKSKVLDISVSKLRQNV